MSGRNGRLLWMTPLVVVGIGCRNVPTSSHQQLDKIDEMRDSAMSHLADMSDNAILQDMALADFHFVGHSSELSGNGEAKLDRMVPLLNHYGGTIHYDSSLQDKNLVDQRLAHVRDYLKLEGCDMSRVKVQVGMAQGRGTDADNAIMIAARGAAKGGASGKQAASNVPPGLLPGGGQTKP